ncbi:hypothetical protein COO60DRAFT_1700018 [Scenedesmus sp. NREL 46B-D3]|nr:hypothetical protein COO60DRAFT_1700018 [Scenedesmus sp. NREL 46B-D3]
MDINGELRETYQYYTLPFCQPKGGKQYITEDLGEVLEGDRLVTTPFEIKFLQDVEHQQLCNKTLDAKELDMLRTAVARDFYFQMFFDDDLPVWGFVGKSERTKQQAAGGAAAQQQQSDLRFFLFTHFHFDIAYNGENVIEVNVSTAASDPRKTRDITEASSLGVEFSYSVKWKPIDVELQDRMDRYSRISFLPQHLEIHWFSIINSCVTVLLLTGFLTTILLRVLKNDFLKYTSRDDEAGEAEDETGWKYLHGDVFRFPQNINLFSAMIGAGTQIFVVVLCVFLLSLVGTFYPYNRGAMQSACLVLYALTASISGYVSGVWYKMMGGRQWVSNVLLVSVLFCGPLLAVFSGSTQALPFGTICIIIVIWALVTFPLTVLGGIAGKNSKDEFVAPCRTTKFPRGVPALPWYRGAPAQALMAGFLPFSAIYIELYYIFASIWGHKLYTIYSILFIVFIILVIVTAFITVALTYFQLAVEDHRWWWRSFLCGGSTAFFILGYCFFYYHYRSEMHGLMQTSFFFGYNAIVCFAFFLMLGSIGWRASLLFVRSIYKAIKCE